MNFIFFGTYMDVYVVGSENVTHIPCSCPHNFLSSMTTQKM